MLNKKTRSEMMKIFNPMDEPSHNRMMAWETAYHRRKVFLQKLRNEGKQGKEYSSSVAEYDKENMQVFTH
jgi:hypothetical protein